ncbi:MAG: hypothetical protein KGK16_16810 [Bradyrhizobium sp.]|uniref:hypothetical protein n=1 Tax=Bradyrhizobium sp. TaxID=376 RepID=UPI00238B674E|nr:hypothetical protein [Bradyrhizobium sp.]MDE2332424.1 hypothetical protein [Bradyrhizobium sp.]MDE2603700.1 hypothetical protein [Bradyrhizobium sp.]
MQWYVYLVTISATAALGWFASELLSRPLRAFFELRRKVLRQMFIAKSISFPKPRELAVSSREIRDYDQALRNVREAQRAFSNLGFRLLAFGENEPVASNVLVAVGLNPVAAGSRLIELSMAYSRPHMDRADLCNQVEKALRSNHPAPARARKWMTGWSFRAPATADL